MRRTNAIRTSLLTMLALLAAAFAAFAPSATAASYSTSAYASRLLSLVNATRADHGLDALRLADGTTTVAAGWTAHMADTQLLSHNPALRSQLEAHGSPDWTTYGENVGQGFADNPDSLFHAYMQSPEHRANILTGDYRYVGVAVVFTGKTAWNTFDFVDAYGTPSAPKAPSVKPVTRHHAQVAKPQTPPAPRPAPSAKPAAPVVHHPVATRNSHRSGHQTSAHRQHRVQVQGLTQRASTPKPIREVVATAAASVSPVTPLPAGRSSRAVLVAVAVLAFVAAARRWTLTVARV